MSSIKNYLSLIKYSHTIFAMPFALIGFALAWNILNNYFTVVPGWHTIIYPSTISPESVPQNTNEIIIRLFLVILWMVFDRSAAMAFNRYLDMKFDALNPRTAIREIPKGIITPGNALAFTIISCVLFITATYFINRICFFLSPL